MTPLHSGELSIDPVIADGCLRLDWHGRSSDREPLLVLGPYFEQAFAAAELAKCRLEMHFERLEHFNSATIAALIEAIGNARTRSIPLALVYSGVLKWQRLSFEALRVFVREGALELRTA